MRTPCTECGLPSVGRGLCKKHYRAFMKYGDPNISANLRGVPFHQRYQIDPETNCWLWIGATVTDGYGVWHAHGEHSAHRASWTMHNGPIPEGLHVLHECDKPNCVNPKHLWLGTHQDNMRDLREKGRAYGAAGEANYSAKLTEQQVLAIMNDPRASRAVAAEYLVTPAAIQGIRRGRSWNHVTGLEKPRASNYSK